MILYNVTVKIEKSVEEEWLEWMKTVHIPDVMNTGLFIRYQICRLLIEEEDGSTYSFQYTCADMSSFERYQQEHARVLQADHTRRYKDRFVAFRTMMEVVDFGQGEIAK